jgi:sarcosine oxidase/L-pipecolate oxidase
LLEDEQKEQKVKRWRWKGEEGRQEDWGADVSWRLAESRELRDVLPGRIKL